MKVPIFIMMLSSRRNLIFRVSIVLNILVLCYVAMSYSGTNSGVDWVPITGNGIERTSELRYIKEAILNETDTRQPESSVRNIEESTSQKAVVSTTSIANKTTSSSAVPSEPDVTNDTLDIVDEKLLSEATLSRLQSLLGCHDRDFLPETLQRGEFWVLKNYVRAEHGNLMCHETITYTTHSEFEFLDNVPSLVQRWMAPISLAIHAPGADIIPAVNSIRYLRDCTNSSLVRQFVTFHIFFSNKNVPSLIPDNNMIQTTFDCTLSPPYIFNSSATYKSKMQLLYPINVARNVARDAALTHFVLPSDIELYPSPDLVPKFLNMIARNEKPLISSARPRVFPISIFEVDAKVNAPWTKTELQHMLANKTAIPFHKFVCPNCHNIPQAKQWMTTPETKQMNVFHVGKRRGRFIHWEPIFIGTHQDPHYDERLSWEGKKDKMTQGYVLCVKDYDFMILNNAFLTHKPGIKHYVKNSKRDSIAGRQNAFVRKVIMPELRRLYGNRTGCAV